MSVNDGAVIGTAKSALRSVAYESCAPQVSNLSELPSPKTTMYFLLICVVDGKVEVQEERTAPYSNGNPFEKGLFEETWITRTM